MMCCNLFVSGRVVWAGAEKETKSARPLKSVVVAVDDRDEGGLPAIMVAVIGDESRHIDKGSWLSAEGAPELDLAEKDGRTVIRWRMLARRVLLSGADYAARRRAEAAQRGGRPRRRTPKRVGRKRSAFTRRRPVQLISRPSMIGSMICSKGGGGQF